MKATCVLSNLFKAFPLEDVRMLVIPCIGHTPICAKCIRETVVSRLI